MKATIFQDIFLVKLLTFVLFRSIAMYFLHFIILYRDEWNFSVCYCTILPLDNIGKYFATICQHQTIDDISNIADTYCKSKHFTACMAVKLLNCDFMAVKLCNKIGVNDKNVSISVKFTDTDSFLHRFSEILAVNGCKL